MAISSPLHELHKEMNATFTNFAGFTMPVQFSNIKDEHLCVREKVGIFDVSHMSNVWISGKDAAELLSKTTIEDANRFAPGKSQYTAIIREDGTIIDDTIFMHVEKNRFMIIPNAGMDEEVTDWLKKQAEKYDFDVKIENVSREYTIIAVQGPRSQNVLQKVTDTDLSNVGFFACTKTKVAGIECIVSHTGYTGELGFELQVFGDENGKKVFKEIMKAGKDEGIKPIGLGARDTLRLEKCFLLAGNEFEGGRTPLEANLSWAIHWDHEFIGKDELLKQKEQGSFQRLTCLQCQGKGIPRHGMKVEKNGKEIGVVSSGTMSPCLKTGIALAYIDHATVSIGDMVDISIRNNLTKAEVVKPPFVKQDWAKS